MEKYSFKSYVYFSRWGSYWYQISEVLDLRPGCLLVIGKGDDIVVETIKSYVSQVITLDIEEKLSPTIVASVEKIPLEEGSVDAILCAEVLEHLPYEKFDQCLSELCRVTKKSVVLSLPHFGPPIKFSFKIPFLKDIYFSFKIPVPVTHCFSGSGGGHYWEIGKRGYPPRKIRRAIEKHFHIRKEFIPFENQYHHFFVLEKK